MQKNELEVVNIRLIKEPSLYSEKPLHSPEDVKELVAKELASYDREVMCVLNMKTNGQVINMNIVSVGSINSALVSPREVFKSAILANAANVILVHNHPSGSVEPSREDILLTKRLEDCGNLLDIPVLDHVIVGGTTGEMFSFKSNDQMDEKWRDRKKKERKHYAEWKAEKERNPTFSDIMRADIDAAVSKAIDYKDFLWNMELMGYRIREGYSKKRGEPYLTFYTEGMKRGHRNYTLGREYALSKLKKRIQEKSNVSAVYQKKTLRYSPVLKITGNRYVSYTRQSVFYITGLQFRYLKRAYRAKHIHSPYAVRGERYRKDICRVHQLSEQCGYLIRHKIYHIKQLERQQTDLKNQKQQMKKSGEEEQMKMLQAELRIVNRILRETKESAVREKQLNLSGTVVKENTTRKRKGNYAKRGNKSISG